jgi:hypothetical protein
MSERPRNEKEEKDEKNGGDSWDEKWRRDPLNAAWWALVLIWAGLVLIADNMGMLNNLGIGGKALAIGFLGAGILALLLVLIRLFVPAYRRPVTGSIILGFILLGVGLGELSESWDVVGALVLIAIGVSIFISRFIQSQ